MKSLQNYIPTSSRFIILDQVLRDFTGKDAESDICRDNREDLLEVCLIYLEYVL